MELKELNGTIDERGFFHPVKSEWQTCADTLFTRGIAVNSDVTHIISLSDKGRSLIGKKAAKFGDNIFEAKEIMFLNDILETNQKTAKEITDSYVIPAGMTHPHLLRLTNH